MLYSVNGGFMAVFHEFHSPFASLFATDMTALTHSLRLMLQSSSMIEAVSMLGGRFLKVMIRSSCLKVEFIMDFI